MNARDQDRGTLSDWRIENDVLVSSSGVAFLAGGNQQPLKYATGELTPAPESVRVFSRNLEARAADTTTRGVGYAHVIFPDKQSVLTEDFPFQPVVRLGETYLEQLPATMVPRVVYPVNQLRQQPNSSLPLDTHLSHTGSLVVLREMMAAVGVEAPEALDRVASRIMRPRRWSGDLGSKLNPERFQEALQLHPDWEVQEFNSGGGFNDGMIDILLSPEAPINKTVLLFGDSFFRLMLKHLSGVFTRVVCLRTRFYHREMVELIEPDLIFTGNAERYLSRVYSDENALPFALYRASRGIAEPFEPEFLEAWRSISSPRAAQSRAFLADRRVPRDTSRS